MPTHPLWLPYDRPDPSQFRAARIDPDNEQVWVRPVVVRPYDPSWPAQFDRVAAAVRAALGPAALAVEHVGSTAVPGLPAKPVIDADLLVADSADESAYLPALQAAGFTLVIREPEWQEHRAFKWADEVDTNLHVFSAGAVEPRRHIAFRDWLIGHAEDREAYARVKLGLAEHGFTDAMDYNNAKGALIYEIYERIFTADPAHPHDPRPPQS